jgi:hypothetical protein
MRRLALLTVLAAALGPAPAQAAPVCGPAGAKTVAAGRLTRVYVQRDTAYACTRGVRRRLELGSTYCYGSSSGCSTLDHAAVAGRFVAYAIQDCCASYGDEYFELSVRNVATGAVRERHTTGEPGEVNATLTALVVRPTGAAAWLWRRVTRQETSLVVSRSARCGEPATLAQSPAVSGLWRSGSRVFWRESGARRSAPLC